jgi:protein-disulfide isomerase
MVMDPVRISHTSLNETSVRRSPWSHRRLAAIAAAALLLIMGGIGPARAQGFTPEQRNDIVTTIRDALKTDPAILGEAIESLQAQSAKKQEAAAEQFIAARHDSIFGGDPPSAGAADAQITIVEFFDTNCPYCRQVDPMLTQWLQNGPQLRIIYRDMPVLGPGSVLGSKALLAAQRQGGYVRLRGALMLSPPDLTEATLKTIVEKLGLDWARLRIDMDDPSIQQRLDTNIRVARELGIEGTPAFVVGNRLVVGSDMADLQSAITAAR